MFFCLRCKFLFPAEKSVDYIDASVSAQLRSRRERCQAHCVIRNRNWENQKKHAMVPVKKVSNEQQPIKHGSSLTWEPAPKKKTPARAVSRIIKKFWALLGEEGGSRVTIYK